VRKLRIINDAWPNNTTAGSFIKDKMLAPRQDKMLVFFPGALDGFCPTRRAKLFLPLCPDGLAARQAKPYPLGVASSFGSSLCSVE
jgi:hypothetical protein